MTQGNPRVTWASFPDPCYNPQERYGNCPNTLLEIISDARIPAEDRIWAFSQCTEVGDKIKRMFAVRCVNETPLSGGGVLMDLITDKRSLNAVIVAERHANGQATDEELGAAWGAARDAAWGAARDAARGAQIEIIKSMLV